MKTLFTSFLLLFLTTTLTSAQSSPNGKTIKTNGAYESKVKYINTDSDTDRTTFQYMTGSEKVPGYEIKICNFTDSGVNPSPIKHFSNGKSAPILQVYVSNKVNYIGGILEDEKGVKTTILNITLKEIGNSLLFTVVGKDFSRSFTLENGCMLKEDSNTTVFHTDKIGVWKINKKK